MSTIDFAAELSAANARRRTFLQAIQDVMRETRGQCTMYEARQALQDAVDVIDASGNWEFLIATRLINLHEPYSTGTVSINSGTNNVTLSGGTWGTAVSPFGEYREIKFGERGMPYKVLSAPTTTSLTLTTNLSGTASNNIVDGSYVLFQARYPLPTDCEPGRDLTLKGPSYIGNIPKRERMTYDRTWNELAPGSTYSMFYTDDEYDDANGCGTIRIEPYPTSSIEVRLTYYRKMVVPDETGDLLMIPEAFERAPVLAAAANICRKKNIQGWQIMRQEAGDLLNKMYNRYASSPAYEGRINPDLSELFDDRGDWFAQDSTMFTGQ